MLTVSIAVLDPDPDVFQNLMKSLKQYTPEMSQLLIFDNGSGSKEFVNIAQQHFGSSITDHKVKLEIIHNDKNIGFSAAHNRNLSRAQAKYFAVLHDDVQFFGQWAAQMLDVLEKNSKVAQVGPKTNVFNTLGIDKIGGWEDTDSPEYCEGSCFIMPVSLAKKYRLFDEQFQYHYFEDMDLSLRLRKDGYMLRNANVEWHHLRGQTTVRMIQNNFDLPGYYVINEYLFRKRWHAYLAKKRFGKTIVIKRGAEIEDVFLTLPIIEALKKKNPDSLILLMTNFSDAVQGCFDIDGYVTFNSPVPCDEFIDLDYAYEKDFRKHIVDCYAKIAGVKPKKKTGTLYTQTKDNEYIDNLLKDYPEFIALDFSDSVPGKQWSRQNYVELGRRLKQEGFKIVTIGKTAAQHPDFLDPDLNLVNVLTLQQTALVIAKSKLFIGNDDILAHFAQTTQIPHIILFGATQPEFVMDTSLTMFIPVNTFVACKGCRHRFAAGAIINCPRNFVCMEVITVDTVYGVFKEVMNQLILRPFDRLAAQSDTMGSTI
ncbi:MAG: glycosyltransferase family 9 protein [Nitrospirota bacterium]